MKGQKTGGRQKGTPNQVTADLKSAILGALDAVGGQAYLQKVAKEQPQVFCALLGKVLPTTLAGDKDNPAIPFPTRIEIVAVEADGKGGVRDVPWNRPIERNPA